jgi:hypothetical protein
MGDRLNFVKKISNAFFHYLGNSIAFLSFIIIFEITVCFLKNYLQIYILYKKNLSFGNLSVCKRNWNFNMITTEIEIKMLLSYRRCRK